MGRVIRPGELRSEDTVGLARWLVGKTLVRTRRGRSERHRLTEVEAYDSERDLACHASRGRTPRTQTLYGPPGTWYVYLCYGIHSMLNIVSGPEGYPAAILIRAVESVSGPGRLTRRLGVGRRFNAARAVPASGLHLEDPGRKGPSRRIRAAPRIGVDYAGPIWAAKPWRFYLEP